MVTNLGNPIQFKDHRKKCFLPAAQQHGLTMGHVLVVVIGVGGTFYSHFFPFDNYLLFILRVLKNFHHIFFQIL